MKRRTPIVAVVAAVAATAVGLSPADAALDTPVVSALDSSTAGHVTGTVTSIAPFVTVRLAAGVEPEVITMSEGTGTFDLETWGHSGTLPVLVASCEVETPVLPEDCSAESESAATFTPTDVVPSVTWPSDTSVGPGDTPTVTVSDPDGGGDLRAIWVNPGDDLGTAVPRDVATPLNLSDGSGFVRLVRCRAGSTTVCSQFSPDQTVNLDVDAEVVATVGAVDPLTEVNTSTDVVVDTDATGTYDLTWTLERDGTPTAGQGGSASGTLDGSGTAEPFTLAGGTLLDGEYDIVVAITVIGPEPDLAAFPEASATGAVTVAGGGPTVTANVGAVEKITRGNPISTVTVDTDVTGTYAITWHLEQAGNPVPDTGGTPTGTLNDSGAATFPLDGSTLDDGTYDVVASVVVTEPGRGTYPAAEATGTVVVDTTGPTAALTPSVGTIYPLIGSVTYPTLTRIDVAGDPAPITGFVVRSAGGTVVRHLSLNVNKTVWNGRNDAGKVVFQGTYGIRAVDADGNLGASVASVRVSRQTLVLKKFVKYLTASGSMYGDRKIGACSQLKIPSSRGVSGSLGYYANTKCATRGFDASAVSTSHFVRVPAAVKYVDMRVDVTGGAAVGYRGSKGVLRYLKDPGKPTRRWVNETAVSTDYGIHRGPTQTLTGMLDPDKFLVWGFLTLNGSRYDVIRFTVVVRYYVLSAAG